MRFWPKIPLLNRLNDLKNESEKFTIALDISEKFHQNRRYGSRVIESQTDKQTICEIGEFILIDLNPSSKILR